MFVMEISVTDIILFNKLKTLHNQQKPPNILMLLITPICFPYFVHWYGIANTLAVQQGFNLPQELCSLFL